MSTFTVDDKTLCDIECILGGYVSPLTGFMTSSDWKSVCETMRLQDGTFFPLPFTLAVSSAEVGQSITLTDSTNYPIARILVEDVWSPDIDWECELAYGTTDANHPYVAYKQAHKGMVYVGGQLEAIYGVRHYDFKSHRMSPSDVRREIKARGWNTVVGFQTRNPMHRAHYELTKYALHQTGDKDARLFLNPVVGETQSVDVGYQSRVHCYKQILEEYPDNTAMLGLLPLAMRMAGPREACLHALIRKNYGCTHFVVGRDHAGPSFKTKEGTPFYGPYDAQELFAAHAEEIGIIPIVSKMIVYNATRDIYQPIDEVPAGEDVKMLSGTDFRRMIRSGEEIPSWFSFPGVINILRKTEINRGVCYYLIGLSGSGKTTLANYLRERLMSQDPTRPVTILDGDIVRQNLSKGLGFSREDRSTNVRRIGYVASEIVRHGGIVICANIAPYDDDRIANRSLIEATGGRYVEVMVDTPLEVCEERDVKGLYKLARDGVIKQFTGISDPFETPSCADITITNGTSIDDALDMILAD